MELYTTTEAREERLVSHYGVLDHSSSEVYT